MIHLELGSERLGRLFPAYLCVGAAGTIRSAGPALRRLAGDWVLGAALDQVLEDTPDLALSAAADKPVQLRLRQPALSLSGSVIAAGGDYLLALGIVPERTWPLAQSLQIADFAPSDPVVAAIMQSGIQAALIDESKTMALDLAAERQRVIDLLGRISRASAHMAHEFNNVVSIIGLTCDRLLRERTDDPDLAQLVGIIRDTAQRAAAMTQAAMALADRQGDAEAHFPPPLPAATPAATPASARHRAPGAARVLVVEDEHHALEALEDLLVDLGYDVAACGDPAAALALLARERFDVLLTDVIMPGITGLELASAAIRIDPEIAVVLMSGYLPEGGERREEWTFLRKPLDLAELAGTLASRAIRPPA
ncbi:response regulator [Novosphingobium bradum]|uniref:Response regulator n=1 Tax=Novosphingobium bradum TaxID=1737444 RepID=A0ABV7IU65_9SPHN